MGVWYFTPRVALRLEAEETSWGAGKDPWGIVEFANRAPRGRRLSFVSESVAGLDLVVRDASGRVVSEDPYWFYDSPVTPVPQTQVIHPGAAYLHPVRLLRSVARRAPGPYTVEAVYDLDGVLTRSNRITIQTLPEPSP